MRAPLPNRLLRFDYGTSCKSRTGANVTCNQQQYGQLRPPQYDLSLLKTPIALFTGKLEVFGLVSSMSQQPGNPWALGFRTYLKQPENPWVYHSNGWGLLSLRGGLWFQNIYIATT